MTGFIDDIISTCENSRSMGLTHYSARISDLLPLLRELQQARETLAKLPKTADGVMVVPGMRLWQKPFFDEIDQEWFGPDIGVYFVSNDMIWDGREHNGSGPHCLRMLYSTREAALAAKDAH